MRKSRKREERRKEEMAWESLDAVLFIFSMYHVFKRFFTLFGISPVVVQALSHVQLFVTPWTAARQAFASFTISRVCSNSCPLSQRCHPIISSSVNPFFSHLQSFPASGSFPGSQLFTSGDQSTGASASALVLQTKIQS